MVVSSDLLVRDFVGEFEWLLDRVGEGKERVGKLPELLVGDVSFGPPLCFQDCPRCRVEPSS